MKRFSQVGPSGFKGYFPSDLSTYGVDDSIVRREMEYLAKAQCVVTEDFREEGLVDEDVVRLAPAGFSHLEMLSSIDYLAAVAEDTWFESEQAARKISDRIVSLGNQYQSSTALYNARDIVEFLRRMRERGAAASKAILERSEFEGLTDLSDAIKEVEQQEKAMTPAGWSEVAKRFPVGSLQKGIVVNIKNYGIFVEIEPGITGLIHRSHLPNGFQGFDIFALGESVKARVLSIESAKRRMEMAFVSEASA